MEPKEESENNNSSRDIKNEPDEIISDDSIFIGIPNRNTHFRRHDHTSNMVKNGWINFSNEYIIDYLGTVFTRMLFKFWPKNLNPSVYSSCATFCVLTIKRRLHACNTKRTIRLLRHGFRVILCRKVLS